MLKNCTLKMAALDNGHASAPYDLSLVCGSPPQASAAPMWITWRCEVRHCDRATSEWGDPGLFCHRCDSQNFVHTLKIYPVVSIVFHLVLTVIKDIETIASHPRLEMEWLAKEQWHEAQSCFLDPRGQSFQVLLDVSKVSIDDVSDSRLFSDLWVN